jgi:hypothetical protein
LSDGNAPALQNLPDDIEAAVMWGFLITAVIGLSLASTSPTAGVVGWLILVMCVVVLCRVLWNRRGLASNALRREALGIALISLSFALVDLLVFMDGLGINPVLNVNFGQGALGIALPILVVAAILYWTTVSLMAAHETSMKRVEWLVLFFVSIFLGLLVINPLTGNGGIGLAGGVAFGSFCLYRSARDLKPRRWSTDERE